MSHANIPASAIERIDPWRVRVAAFRPDMRTDAVIYANPQLWQAIREDLTLKQVANITALPGIVGPALAMPDAHQGYGFPIGGVAATDVDRGGVISPGGVGFDINCGVRLLGTDLSARDARARMGALVDAIYQRVPVGFGKGKGKGLGKREMEHLLGQGAAWVVGREMGTQADLDHTEEQGRYTIANPAAVSTRARERGARQLGTLGSGNHFVEVQRVDALLEPATARTFGLRKGQVVVMVHTGSRGLGHQVCSDHVAIIRKAMARHGIELPDRQLACAPVRSPEGQAYLGAMAGAANFAWANRQVITHRVREALGQVFGRRVKARVVYDVAHNIAKIERHTVQGAKREVCVHRKGSTRAFAAGSPGLPDNYRKTGQPVIIPGSMGTCSYVLVGTQQAMNETFGSVCHGAGRAMSRSAARKRVRAKQVVAELRQKGILIRSGSKAGIVEEFPGAYKDVVSVVSVVEGAGLARPVARLVPLAVVKG